MEQTVDPWKPGTPVERNTYNWTDEPFLIPRRSEGESDGFSAIDLFCGCGGFSHGFGSVGITSVLGVDVHPPSIRTFQANHPEASAILGDIRAVSDRDLMLAVDDRRIDVVCAGVPCQGFSLSNRKRWAEDDRNYLFREFIRGLTLFKPRVALLENVSGIRSAGNGKFASAITRAIEECGYTVECRVLVASDYGVPQKRTRVFFMGVLDDSRPRWPAATHSCNEMPAVTVWDAIGDLPPVAGGERAEEYGVEPESDYQRAMRAGCDQLLNHVAPKHHPAVIEKIKNTAPGSPIYPRFAQRIRLHPDRPSPTQVSGGIRPQYQFGHPSQDRGLTVRERCRLQSFPDTFEILGGTVQGRVQTGNAVPPLLAGAIGKQIVSILRGEPRSTSALPPIPNQIELFA